MSTATSSTTPKHVLTASEIDRFRRTGFVVLRSLVADAQISRVLLRFDAVQARVERAQSAQPRLVAQFNAIVHCLNGRRAALTTSVLRSLSAPVRCAGWAVEGGLTGLLTRWFPRYDNWQVMLFRQHLDFRRLGLGVRLTSAISELLGDRPVIFFSSNFIRGGQLSAHRDRFAGEDWLSGDQVIAAWIALEDVHPTSGPLGLYAGSHRSQSDEDERGLPQVPELARGDVVLWHGDLRHCSMPTTDSSRLRRAMVFHYASRALAGTQGDRLERLKGGYWRRNLLRCEIVAPCA